MSLIPSPWSIAVENLRVDRSSKGSGRLSSQENPGRATPKNQRTKHLARLLIDCIDDFNGHADPAFVIGMGALAAYVDEKVIALNGAVKSHKGRQRKPFVSVVVQYIEPALLKAVDSSSPSFQALMDADVFPLSKMLRAPADYLLVSTQLTNVVRSIESMLGMPTPIYTRLLREAATINLASAILETIHREIRCEHLRWCKFCFRRPLHSSDFCSTHGPADGANNTEYKKGERIRRALDQDKDMDEPEHKHVLEYWGAYRCERKLFDANLVLIPDIPPEHATSKEINSIRVSPDLFEIVEATSKQPWSDISVLWEQLMAEAFPHALGGMEKLPTKCADWEDFVMQVRSGMNDPAETTKHPYWVLCILLCAEDWLELEGPLGDKRLPDQADEVWRLFQSGVTNKSEIARKLGRSRVYVGDVLKGKPRTL